MRNKSGPNTDPCGTPNGQISERSESTPLVETYCLCLYKYEVNQLRTVPLIP